MMKKSFLGFVLVLVCSFAFCLPKDERLVVLTCADNPPYEFVSSGVIVGFDIDLAKLIAKRLHRQCDIKDMPFASVIPSLRAKQGDMAIAAITPTDLRKKSLDFSIPYQSNASALVIVKTEDFSNVEGGAYFPLELLKKRILGVQLGTHHEADIREADIEGATIRRYDSVSNLVAEMEKSVRNVGTLYGIILGVPEAKAIVGKNEKLAFYKLKFEDSFAIAFPNESLLVEDINRIINDLVLEGKISELEKKWGISD
ncbi:MAG: ABC transporter substrate-binding protein [Puniceicoccales bacterium]|jgi:polar amino acid transport system substrate-binding protein|nr:ABC transporter substrate-binding protein [Puniceicoccales bacterium]